MAAFDPFPRVQGRFGAPMGRHGAPYSAFEGARGLYARHCGGDGYYDKGGAYWGHSRVWAVWSRGGALCCYVEADSAESAKAVVKAASAAE